MKHGVVILAATLGLSASAQVGTPAKKVVPSKMSCEEFVGLDETVKPQVVYFIEGATRSGKIEDAVISVDRVSDPVLWVLDECKKTPKARVWQKVENWVKTEARKM